MSRLSGTEGSVNNVVNQELLAQVYRNPKIIFNKNPRKKSIEISAKRAEKSIIAKRSGSLRKIAKMGSVVEITKLVIPPCERGASQDSKIRRIIKKLKARKKMSTVFARMATTSELKFT